MKSSINRFQSVIIPVMILFLASVLISGCEQSASVDPELAAQTAREILSDGIKTGPESTRKMIVKLTSSMEVDEALPLLDIAINDRQSKIVETAIKRLIFFHDPSSKDIIRDELGTGFDSELIDTLIELGADDIEENIEKGMRSLTPLDRAEAVEMYGKYKGSGAEEKLRIYLDDNEAIVRIKAKTALARLGDESVLGDIAELLESDGIIARAGAVKLIDEFDLKEYRDNLLEFARNDKTLVSSEALRILYEWDDDEARELLKEKLVNTEKFVMYDLLEMIEKKHDLKMIDSLKKLMSSASPLERYASARLIVSLDYSNNRDALEFLLSGMESEVPGVREQVIISLANLPDVPEVRRALEETGLKDEHPKVLEATISTLGKIGDMSTINILAPFLKDDELQIRATAAVAVLNIISREKSE
ncbi:HEAT repeat domain-containing protein [bacterium]|nr:HEAT repeat domain-containing protein [bacterium]